MDTAGGKREMIERILPPRLARRRLDPVYNLIDGPTQLPRSESVDERKRKRERQPTVK